MLERNISGTLIRIKGARLMAEVKVISGILLSPPEILVAAKEAGIQVIGTIQSFTASKIGFTSCSSIEASGK